ncbi:MAG: hypothetical protein WBC42_10590, partial [Candidatus Zixiibacteriota bacterium]
MSSIFLKTFWGESIIAGGEAQRTGAPVQIIGEVVFPEVKYDTSAHLLRFPIVDENRDSMTVVY